VVVVTEKVFSGLQQTAASGKSRWESVREEIELLGYSVLRGYRSGSILERMRQACDEMYGEELASFGRPSLEAIGDIGVVRSPFLKSRLFWDLCCDSTLTELLKELLGWPYILHVQRLVISDTDFVHPAGVWHREPPYQTFVTSVPIAVSTILSLDPMTPDNGPLFVLKSSHKWASVPSTKFLTDHKVQLSLDAGDLLVFDSALFHRNSPNDSERRRSLVTIYSSPMLKQQTDIAGQVGNRSLEEVERVIFGVTTRPFESDDAYRGHKLKTKQKIY
jgi:ectoine hydroxylase-related dioxygenase (phytanoyl-CoA dioxygenase family)